MLGIFVKNNRSAPVTACGFTVQPDEVVLISEYDDSQISLIRALRLSGLVVSISQFEMVSEENASMEVTEDEIETIPEPSASQLNVNPDAEPIAVTEPAASMPEGLATVEDVSEIDEKAVEEKKSGRGRKKAEAPTENETPSAD